MFILRIQGPDDLNTWSECWGSTATSRGREKIRAATLRPCVVAAMALGHNNFSISRGKRLVLGMRKDCQKWLSNH